MAVIHILSNVRTNDHMPTGSHPHGCSAGGMMVHYQTISVFDAARSMCVRAATVTTTALSDILSSASISTLWYDT